LQLPGVFGFLQMTLPFDKFAHTSLRSFHHTFCPENHVLLQDPPRPDEQAFDKQKFGA